MTNGNGRSIVIGVCESQPLMVTGLRATLEQSGAYNFLPAARTLDDAARQALLHAPAVMFLDRAFGAAAIEDLLTRVRGRVSTGFIVWSPAITEPEALRLLKVGARGIMRKSADAASVLACVNAVAGGGTWMEDSLFHHRGRQAHVRNRSDLTTREQQVLGLVEQGMRNKDIAQELGIRPGTVKIHLKHIFEKTGVRGRYGLALCSLQRTVLPMAI